MKIVICPDSFKESLSAVDVADALHEGLRSVLSNVECICIPIADGGEGTVAALVAGTNGSSISTTVTGPLGQPLLVRYGLLGGARAAVIELAAASGLGLVPVWQRNPALTTTRGTGELILAALSHRIEQLIIGIGGSATIDGGVGLCQALGVQFFNASGQLLEKTLTGSTLNEIADIDLSELDPRLADVHLTVASDVDNPLLGGAGAAATFGPQKGASPAIVASLESALATYYTLVERTLQTRVIDKAGAGAAGGVGAALMAFVGAELRPGVELISETIKLGARLAGADLVITGEGRIDAQTLHGKTALGVADIAARLGIPVVAVGGSLADDAENLFADRFAALEACVCRPMGSREALQNARANLVRAGRRIAKWLQLGQRMQTV